MKVAAISAISPDPQPEVGPLVCYSSPLMDPVTSFAISCTVHLITDPFLFIVRKGNCFLSTLYTFCSTQPLYIFTLCPTTTHPPHHPTLIPPHPNAYTSSPNSYNSLPNSYSSPIPLRHPPSLARRLQ